MMPTTSMSPLVLWARVMEHQSPWTYALIAAAFVGVLLVCELAPRAWKWGRTWL
jgi:hypothetical protein